MSVFAESDCIVGASLDADEVAAGEVLYLDVHIEHNRLAQVTVPLAVWVEDAAGGLVTGRLTAPVTFEYGDTLDRGLSLTVPETTAPGDYVVRVGIERMGQGLAWASAPFQIR